MDAEIAFPSPEAAIVELQQPADHSLPLVLASPHSGSEYPADFLAASRLDAVALRRSEDSFVHQLFSAAPSLGAPLLSARFPRAYLDVNREAYELDPTMFADALPGFVNAGSPRVRMGLGTIARVIGGGEEIYARKLCFAEAERRIESLCQPNHKALLRLLEEADGRFGGCLLIDCHSMPSAGSGCGQDGVDIVLGDCHGATCAAEILDAAHRFFGTRVCRRDRCALCRRLHHRPFWSPEGSASCLQIEINRSLCMNERTYPKKPFFVRLRETWHRSSNTSAK
jgi:N-formylglutamate amidohydrolase